MNIHCTYINTALLRSILWTNDRVWNENEGIWDGLVEQMIWVWNENEEIWDGLVERELILEFDRINVDKLGNISFL